MNKKSLLNRIIIGIGLFLGAFALSALAVDWTAPTANPPANNAPAPINVSISPQAKAGPFAVGKATAPSTGYNLDVAGNGLFGGLLVSGKTVTNSLQIGSTDISKAGYVLTNKDGTGEAEWKPNTSGLSGASRIYCAAASDGSKYYVPKEQSHAFYELIKKINTEVSSELPWGEQLLNDSSPSTNNGVGLLKASFLTSGSTSYDNPATDHPLTNPPRAYCPTGKSLLFHSMVGWAKDEANNALERIVTVVKGDYTTNSISCVAKGADRPTLVVGVGLCI